MELHQRTRYNAFYAQEQWTLSRTTLQGAIRYDRSWSYFPEQTLPPSNYLPFTVSYPRTEGVRGYNNISPRFGVAYDLFGNAKTAIKGSVSKYMLPWSGGWAKRYDPFTTVTDSRTWRDLNLDDIAQDNEIGPSGNANFGVSTGRSAAAGLSREYNLEETLGVQHQLHPRVSVFGGIWFAFAALLCQRGRAEARS